jgi:hypothetical protein
MGARLYLALLAAACARTPTGEAEVAARRAALGLPAEPLPFADAMKNLERKGAEAFLARIPSRGPSRALAFDTAVEILSLLERADATTATARAADPAAFDAALAAARTWATTFARAVGRGERGELEARGLLASCIDCHQAFKRPW